MAESTDLNEFHWLLTIVQSIDVGVVVVDRQFRVEVWNSFMENRSGRTPEEVLPAIRSSMPMCHWKVRK